jgi:hypothetical protein
VITQSGPTVKTLRPIRVSVDGLLGLLFQGSVENLNQDLLRPDERLPPPPLMLLGGSASQGKGVAIVPSHPVLQEEHNLVQPLLV